MHERITPEALALLTEQERARLTYFQWRYVLQADGFTVAQARRLCFQRWLYFTGRLLD